MIDASRRARSPIRASIRGACTPDQLNAYRDRLLKAGKGGINGVLAALEDFPVGTPIPTTRSTHIRHLSTALSESFVLRSDSKLVSDAMRQFEEYWDTRPDISAEKTPMFIGGVTWLHKGLAINSWVLPESEIRNMEMSNYGKVSKAGSLMFYLDFPADAFSSDTYYLPLRSRISVPVASKPEIFISAQSFMHQEPLRPKESPHSMRILFLSDIGRYAPAIQDLASQSESVQVDLVVGKVSSVGRAAWPRSLDAKLSDPLYSKAWEILVWAYESTRDCQAEYVRISDGWNQLYCFVGPHTLTVGPLVTPRYRGFSTTQSFSAYEAFLALLWKAFDRKHIVGNRLYTPDTELATTGDRLVAEDDATSGFQHSALGDDSNKRRRSQRQQALRSQGDKTRKHEAESLPHSMCLVAVPGLTSRGLRGYSILNPAHQQDVVVLRFR